MREVWPVLRLLSPVEVADRLAVSRDHVFTLMRSGSLAFVRIGRCYRVTETDLEEFVAACRTPRHEVDVLKVRARLGAAQRR